jgi:hypothetical protein
MKTKKIFSENVITDIKRRAILVLPTGKIHCTNPEVAGKVLASERVILGS